MQLVLIQRGNLSKLGIEVMWLTWYVHRSRGRNWIRVSVFPAELQNVSMCVKDTRLITLIVAYFHGNPPPSGNLALLANDTERVIILVPG